LFFHSDLPGSSGPGFFVPSGCGALPGFELELWFLTAALMAERMVAAAPL